MKNIKCLSKDPDTVGTGRSAVLFGFVFRIFKVKINAITQEQIIEAESENYSFHLGGEVS